MCVYVVCDHCLYWLVQPLQTVDSRFEDERQRFLDLQEMLKSFQRGVQAWLKEIKVYGVCMTCGVHGTCLCVRFMEYT